MEEKEVSDDWRTDELAGLLLRGYSLGLEQLEMGIEPPIHQAEVAGVLANMRSEKDAGCLCCDGPHIFWYGVEIVEYESIYPGLKVDSVNDWLHEELSPFRDQPGLTVRVRLEVSRTASKAD